LRDQIVPTVAQLPGFKTGHWTRAQDGGNGMSMIIFESEEAAQGMKQMLEQQGPGSDAVDLDSVEVREVVASA
jgi:hypothetical protein